MNVKSILGILLLIVSFVSAQKVLNTVVVPTGPTGMLHYPSAAAGRDGFTGKVEYTLTAGGYDSIVITLSIEPAAGGAALPLKEVSGDVGLIRIVKPGVAENHHMFFETGTIPQPGVQYVAKIIATADTSNMKKATDNYLATMTKINKATLCGGGGDQFESVGAGPIPMIWMLDGPHGVRPLNGAPATLYPTCAGEACTWDVDLAYQQGASKAEEFRAQGANCSLGPALDLVYHPQGGRASEYYSEDPYLSGRMAAADCRGLQSKGVAATIKHFAANNKEDNRYDLSANIDERSMREIYLYNWKPSVVDANCWAVMSAYNKVNHSYAGSNKYLLTDVLRNEWGYKFLVMTDWGAKFDSLAGGMKYGADIDMPYPDMYSPSSVAGQPDSIVNMHAQRIIYTNLMLGDMATGYNRTAFTAEYRGAAHRKTARDVGSGGIILARNNNNTLPIPKTGVKIAITGPFAMDCRKGPGGSSSVTPAFRIDPRKGISELLAGTAPYPAIAGASTIVSDITTADYIIVFVGVTGEKETGDRPYLALQDAEGETDVAKALAVTTAKTVVVFTGGSAAMAGKWSKPEVSAILIAFYPGQEQGYCIADVLFNNVNPSGKLPVTFPVDGTQLPNWNLVGFDLNYPKSDTAHGYFRVNKKGQTPLFAFGHGLSYSTFEYSPLQIYPAQIAAGDRVTVRVTVMNNGPYEGKEVVQLYLSMPSSDAALPVRVQDLRGFKKVSLKSGEQTQVDFVLTQEEMQVFKPSVPEYSGNGGTWQVLTGNYGVRVGTSSDINEQPSKSGNFSVQ
jgi:beta-glucosidase